MKSPGRLILTASGLGLLFLSAAPSFATVVDNLAPGHASIIATSAGVTFHETYNSASSTLAPATSGFSRDFLMPQGESSANFTQSPSSTGASNSDCALAKVGQSCSLEIGSLPFPIVLTYLGPGSAGSDGSGNTGLLGIGGTGKNGAWSDDVTGLFVNENSGRTSLNFLGPGVCIPPTDAAPEPRFVSAMALAGVLIGIVVMKRRREASRVSY